MKYVIIIDNKIEHRYEAEKKKYFSGPLGTEKAIQVEVPENMVLGNVQWIDGKIVEITPFESYISRRQKRYNELGATKDKILEAIIQKEFDNDNTLMQEISDIRQIVKQEIPKD